MRSPAPFLALLLVLAGCGQATQSSAAPVAPPSPPAASQAPDSPVPSTAPTAPVVIDLAEAGDDLLVEGGRYTYGPFSPTVTFQITGEWQAVQLFNGFFDIQRDPGSPDVIAVQFANVEGAFGEDSASPQAVTSVAEAIARIKANPRIGVVGESPSLMGGLEGTVVEIENTSGADVSVLDVPPGPLGLSTDRRLWIALFDTPEGVLAILVGGSIARWDEALTAAEPVLESIEVGS